jgi:hypothetical protein
MKKCKRVFIRQGLLPIFLLVVLAWLPIADAAPFDRSDLNGDGSVDVFDLEIFSTMYLEEDYQTVDWCNFYESSVLNEKYFRSVTSDKTANHKQLLDFIAVSYDCQTTASTTASTNGKSDLNGDSFVDLDDLILFSEAYLERNWETVDWCLFFDSTLAGDDFEGRSTKYYLRHFGELLSFINDYFYCGGPEPPATDILLENVPKNLVRIADDALFTGDYYITDPTVGSLFIYDADLVLKAEIKALNKPLGVAIDSQGRILVGNNGRNNIEVYDPATGELLAVFGEGLIKMPTAITVDDLGNIYVTDSLSNNVRVFDPTYALVRTIGQRGDGEGGLDFPVDAEIIGLQEIFVADQGNDRIQVYDLEGNWLRSITFAGVDGQNCNWFTGVCEIPGMPPFTRLQALDTDSLGQLHVLDNFAAAVVIFDPADGTFLNAYGQYGTDAGSLRVPMDVLVSAMGTALVTAGDSDRVEVLAIP